MLDEPTNHLDSDAKHWLMKFLAAYRGALVVVSHDLGLLDGAITRSCTWTATASCRASGDVLEVPGRPPRRRGAASQRSPGVSEPR